MKKHVTRRRFLGAAASAAIFPSLIPSSALGLDGNVAPSNRIGMGFIGVGGKGTDGMRNFLGCNDAQAVAVCDVDSARRENARKMAGLPPQNAYNDFRELIARDDIDAVLVATPDHWHVLASIAATRAGKHVYCEKPLSNTIAEGRALVETVDRYGTVFQHGTQLRSLRNVRFACELVRNGRIGALRQIVIGSPPGLATGLHPAEPIPPGLDYDLWLGPAPYAPYTPWRVGRECGLPGWYFISDYSQSGWIAAFAVHDIDIAHWGMDTELTGPVEVEGEGVFPIEGLFDTVMTYRLEYKYANGIRLIVTSTDRNPHGVRFVGEQGWIFTRSEIDAEPKSLLRETIAANEIRLPESRLHEQNFLDCIRTRSATLTPAEVAHRSTTVGLLGGIALKLRRKLRWDPRRERFIDDPEADRLLDYTMRPPWRL
jgi:predicted dehydrogenase